jgi:hypothetical protein
MMLCHIKPINYAPAAILPDYMGSQRYRVTIGVIMSGAVQAKQLSKQQESAGHEN